jgi:hypothetical protein
MTVARLRLAPSEETMFPPRAPFFSVRLGKRGAQTEDEMRGNLPVPPVAPSTAHGPEIGQ